MPELIGVLVVLGVELLIFGLLVSYLWGMHDGIKIAQENERWRKERH